MQRDPHATALTGAAGRAAERRAFYETIDTLGMTPLWEVLGSLVPPSPKSAVAPVHFRYDAIRPHVMTAGRLITAGRTRTTRAEWSTAQTMSPSGHEDDVAAPADNVSLRIWN